MQHKLPLTVFLFSLAVVIFLIPACARKTPPPAPAAPVTEEDEAAKQAQIEEERLKKEAEAREWRAAIKFIYEKIQFKKDSHALTPAAEEILMRKARWLHDHPYVTVIIEGHTDEPGSKEYNIALGDRRAGEAKSFLIRQDIATERLIAVSYGKEKPIDPKRTEEAKNKNRRVNFVIE